MSGKPLRLKDLIPVTFTLAKDGDKRALIAKDVCTQFIPECSWDYRAHPSMNMGSILSLVRQQMSA